MVYINLLVILLFIMLALLSRMHYSKYKGKRGLVGCVMGLWYAMAETVYVHIRDRISRESISSRLRRVQVVSPKKLEEMTDEFIIKLIAACLGICFIFNLVSGVTGICEPDVAEDANIVEREDYQGDIKYQDIYMEVDGDTFVYPLEVAPMEYTEEDFYQQAEDLFAQLEEEILGDNESFEHVSSDLKLPLSDEQGIFEIKWKSDNPEYLTSTGRVVTEELDTAVPVVLTATIEYLTYSISREYVLVVEKKMENVGNSNIDIAEETLDNLESENRNKKTIILPSDISGVGISTIQKNNNTSVQILLLGILASVILVALKLSRLKESAKIECNMLSSQYAFFVNKLWLLLGTGMTIKAGMKQIISEAEEKDILIRELEYTVNQIDSGYDEARAYEQLGLRIGLPAYSRLLNNVSQNLVMGTKNLRKLMEEEVFLSLEERKESARKKGEEASTKLIFPMVLLLAIVMVILIVPAFVGF